MSKVLIDSEISHKEYATIINEKEKYRRLKEDTRMKSQRNDAEKDKLIKESKSIGINKIIWQNNGKTSSQKKFFFKNVKRINISAKTFKENGIENSI